jgi:hypothetical protein
MSNSLIRFAFFCLISAPDKNFNPQNAQRQNFYPPLTKQNTLLSNEINHSFLCLKLSLSSVYIRAKRYLQFICVAAFAD